MERARRARLLPAEGPGPEVVDALLTSTRPAAGVLALALTQAGGEATGWSQAWRERLRALRRHRVAVVAEHARRISTVEG